MNRLLCFTALLALSACKVGNDLALPAVPFTNSWQSSSPKTTAKNDEAALAEWWQQFHDPLLSELITEAQAHNHDIRIALANLDEARALRRESRSPLFPQLDASASASREGFSTATSNNSNNREKERDTVDGGLNASWEPDLFGRIRRQVEASSARLKAEKEALHGVQLAVTAEVARNYFEVRGLQKRIEVTERSITLVSEVEKLADTQYKAGAVTEFDVSRARGERETIAATLPALKADLRSSMFRISVLTGKDPKTYTEKLSAPAELPEVTDIVPVGLPSEILRRRPDVRQAEAQLAAATADVGVEIGTLFPSISLTGSVGAGATTFGNLFASGAGTYGLGALVDLPLFEGGARIAKIDAAKAREKSQFTTYEKAVLGALEDTENALTRYGAEWQTLTLLRSAVKTREEGYRIAGLRYKEGEENFLTMLDAERSLITAQDNLIQSETRIRTSLTALYKALGGGWEQTINPTPLTQGLPDGK